MKFQFSIRTILIAILVIAVGLGTFSAYQKHRRWSKTKRGLQQWASKLERKPGKGEVYCTLFIELPNGSSREFSVSTTEPRHKIDANGNEEWNSDAETLAKSDPSRFLVVPSGRWVDTLDQVIETWDRYRNNAIEQ